MPQLKDFNGARQQDPNSCWASASRAISNYYLTRREAGQNPMYPSDQAFANAWAAETKNPVNRDISIQQSAAAALGDLGYPSVIDDSALPTQVEIRDAILAGTPLLAIVGAAPPRPNPNPNYQNGHWVVIVGISDDLKTISVFDPDTGRTDDVPYNAATYRAGSYWQNTSYVDPNIK